MKMKYINSLWDMINAARNGFVCARFISVRIYAAVSLKVFPFIYIHVPNARLPYATVLLHVLRIMLQTTGETINNIRRLFLAAP